MKASINLMRRPDGMFRWVAWCLDKTPAVMIAEGAANDQAAARREAEQAIREYEQAMKPAASGPADPISDAPYRLWVSAEKDPASGRYHWWVINADTGDVAAKGSARSQSDALTEAQAALQRLQFGDATYSTRPDTRPQTGTQLGQRRPREVTSTRSIDWKAIAAGLRPLAAKQKQGLARAARQARQVIAVQKKAAVAEAKRSGTKGWLFEHPNGWWCFVAKSQRHLWEDDGQGDDSERSPARREKFLLGWLAKGATRRAI